MLRNILALLFSLSLLVSAQAQYYTIIADSQNPESIVVGPQFSGNTPFIKFKYYDDAVPVDLAPWTMELDLFLSQYDTNGSFQIAGTVSGSTNEAVFLGATNAYLWSRDYYFSIKGIHLSGYVKTMATGKLIIEYDPATSTNVWAQLTQLNINFFSNNVGAQVESNRVNIGIMQTGKTDVVTFNATNALKVDVATFNATNALKVDLTDYAIATNLFATGKVDLVTFNATNALKVDITTFNATNALKTDLATFNATNALKADKTTVNATSAVFEVRIASNETYRTTTQAATNTALQLQIANNFAAQGNTNTGFNVRIVSNETFRTTTQPATNTAIQNQVTGNLTNQNVTNVAVQVQIAGLSSAGLSRYDAYVGAPDTVWVLASSTNVTASRSGATFTFTIPANTKLTSVKIRVDGGNTDGGKIYLSLGAGDMNQSGITTSWLPSPPNVMRENDQANIPGVTALLNPADLTQIVISGLSASSGVWQHIELRF